MTETCAEGLFQDTVLSQKIYMYISSGKSDSMLAATQNNSFVILDLNISENKMFHFGWTKTYSSLYLFVV